MVLFADTLNERRLKACSRNGPINFLSPPVINSLSLPFFQFYPCRRGRIRILVQGSKRVFLFFLQLRYFAESNTVINSSSIDSERWNTTSRRGRSLKRGEMKIYYLFMSCILVSTDLGEIKK